MAWSAPATWSVGEAPPASKMNAQIRDNLSALSTHAHTGADGDGAELGAYFDAFGTGADGALHVESGSPVTITADKNYTTVLVDVGAVLTINSGVTMRANTSITNNGMIRSKGAPGGNASASTGGAGGSSSEGGGAGGAGGGPSTSGASGSPNSFAQPGMGAGTDALAAVSVPGITGIGRNGGSGGAGGSGGGGGTSAAGGGGEGGGWARYVSPIITGTGTFDHSGGAGGNAFLGTGTSAGGGHGAGGGYIETLTVEEPGGSLTWTKAGGAGGSGVGGGANGSAGQTGVEIHVVLTSATG